MHGVVIAIGAYWLVVVDVDGTLLGDEDGWSRLGLALEANPHILMVPNSSRPLASLQKSWAQQTSSIRFPAEVGALGTEISIGGQDVGWSDRFRSFNRTPIDRVMTAMGYQTNGDEFQTPLKASYSVPRQGWASATAALESNSPVEIVTSGDFDFDVIPLGAGKAAPVTYLADHFQVDPGRVVAAGDSMNDLAMLAASPNRIVVANAEPTLLDSTRGSALHTTRTHADGVIEGLQALGLLT